MAETHTTAIQLVGTARYTVSKEKVMDAYVARQPIFVTRKNIFGYKLLFRNGMANMMPEIDGDTATSQLLSSTFFTIGINELTNGKNVFILQAVKSADFLTRSV